MNRLDYRHDATDPPVMSPALRQAFQSWDNLLEWLPAGVYACDRNGLLVKYNRRAVELWGYAPELGSPLIDEPILDVLRSGEPIHGREVTITRPDGSRISVLSNIEALRDRKGRVVGAVNCFQDITEQKAAKDALRERERWYHDLLQALPAAIYTTDAEGRITFYNKAAAELAGQTPEIGSDKWCVTWKLYQPDGTPLLHGECPMAIALKENRAVRGAEAIVERPDGTRIPMVPYPTPLRNEAGELIGAVNMLVDISERKKAEALQKTLIDELNHRVKNTLATVQALAAHSIRGGSESMRTEFDQRLIALSRAHDQLTREHWASAGLEHILSDTLNPYSDGRGERISCEGDSVKLPPKMALVLAMIFHELATNAAKYGALSSKDGRVDVSWVIAADNVLNIRWQESGGPAVQEPEQTGFGIRLLSRGIAHELGGNAQIHFDASGVRCLIEVPLAAAA